MTNPATVHLPPLPYPEDALAPHISADTVALHYGKHHAGYVANVNRLVAGTPSRGSPAGGPHRHHHRGPVQQRRPRSGTTRSTGTQCIPKAAATPAAPLRSAIEDGFGSVDGFRKQFTDAACGHFGSGWVWLVAGGDDLEVMATANADLPQRHGRTPLLTIDVWEHAYYLDYRNARPAYVDRWIDNLVNWDFAAANLAAR